MKKRIYLPQATLELIREGVRLKFSDHPQRHILGKSQQIDYEPFQEIIERELETKLKAPQYNRLLSEFPGIGKRITYFTLWTIFYDNVKNPPNRKRMHRDTIRMLMLFAFDEVREELLVESSPEENTHFQSSTGEMGLSLINNRNFEYYDKINESIILESISNAKSEIRILKNFLNKWNSIRPYLEAAAGRGCKIRLLISEPHVKPVVNRSKYILPANKNKNGLPELRRRILDEIENWEGKDKVEVAEHDCLPGFNLYAIDDTYFFSVYWYKVETIRGPYFVIKNEHDFKKHIDNHFENMWKEAYDLRNENRKKPKVNLDKRLKKYIGNWYLYCNKGIKDKESYQLRFMEQGEISENLLILSPNGYQLQATFVSPVHGKLNGFAEIHSIHDEFLEVKLRVPFEKDSIHFLIHIGQHNEDHIIGVYNFMYTNQPMLGTGLAAIVRCKDEVKVVETNILNGTHRPIEEIQDEGTQKLLRYLQFPTGTRIESVENLDDPKLFNRFSKPFKFRGVYKLFAYKGGSGKTYITESLMKIDGFQQITHKRGGKLEYTKRTSEGKAELMKDDNMLLAFKNLKNRKLGIMFVYCSTHDPSPDTYYTGVFCGFGISNNQRIMGNRVILQYLGEDEKLFNDTKIKRSEVGSAEFHQLPPEIKSILAGRTQNSLGFFYLRGSNIKSALARQAREEIHMGQVYFDAACQKALSNEPNQVEAVIDMFDRALKHGFEPKEAFVKKLEEFENKYWLGMKMKREILNNEKYLSLINT